MRLIIRQVQESDWLQVHAFQCEYLDEESFDAFIRRVQANPDLYLAAFDENELAGICYGHPRHGSVVVLQGIAVNLDTAKLYARRGIGSRLIREFEHAARSLGYCKIGLGAADDLKVEHFYCKNGYQAVELVAKGSQHEEYERVKINGYDSGKQIQQELRLKHRAHEVIFIFEKWLDPAHSENGGLG